MGIELGEGREEEKEEKGRKEESGFPAVGRINLWTADWLGTAVSPMLTGGFCSPHFSRAQSNAGQDGMGRDDWMVGVMMIAPLRCQLDCYGPSGWLGRAAVIPSHGYINSYALLTTYYLVYSSQYTHP